MKLERLLFSIAAMMLLLPLTAQEKEQSDMRFWKHLTLGGEIGTMGIGLEVATPLHPNIRLRAGIVAFPFVSRETYVARVDMVSAKGNSYDYMAAKDERVAYALQSAGYPLHFLDFPNPLLIVEEKLRRIEGKLLVDFVIDEVSNLQYETTELCKPSDSADGEWTDNRVYGVANCQQYLVRSGSSNTPDYYGLMDRQGKRVTPPVYTSITAIGKDCYLCQPDGVIINDRGEKVE